MGMSSRNNAKLLKQAHRGAAFDSHSSVEPFLSVGHDSCVPYSVQLLPCNREHSVNTQAWANSAIFGNLEKYPPATCDTQFIASVASMRIVRSFYEHPTWALEQS